MRYERWLGWLLYDYIVKLRSFDDKIAKERIYAGCEKLYININRLINMVNSYWEYKPVHLFKDVDEQVVRFKMLIRSHLRLSELMLGYYCKLMTKIGRIPWKYQNNSLTTQPYMQLEWIHLVTIKAHD